jgi:hypothetical protein
MKSGNPRRRLGVLLTSYRDPCRRLRSHICFKIRGECGKIWLQKKMEAEAQE